MNKTYAIRQIAILSIAHMGIDFLCAFSLYHSFSDILNVFFLYNFCAFALQMPIGLIVDFLNEKRQEKNIVALWTTVAGIAFTILGSFVSPLISGLGNALFHCGGGILTINYDDSNGFDSRGLGVFVAPGAIGLFLGSWFFESTLYTTVQLIVSVLLLLIACFIVVSTKTDNRNIDITLPKDMKEWAMVFVCFLVVLLRSLGGMSIVFSWKQGFVLSLISVIALASGKSAGGYLYTIFKERRMIILTLSLSALFYAFGNHMLSGIFALFFFNMTMPLTLYLLAKQLKDAPGFAFGILTFSLFLGYLPVLYGTVSKQGPFPLGSIVSLLSMVLLLIYVRMSDNG